MGSIRFLKARAGHRIAYAIDGDGPPLVFPAWWISHVENDLADPAFRAFFERLAQRFTVVRYDRAGVGLSDRERGALRLEDEVSDLETLMETLELDRASLFGLSCGGPLAIRYAALHPERVERLVLYGAYVRGDALAPREAQAALAGLVRSSWGLGARALVELFAPDMSTGEAQRFAEDQRASASPEMAARLLELTYAMDVSDMVDRVRAPTLVLHRKDDRAIHYEHGRDLAARIEGAMLVSLDGRAHLPWREDASSIAAAVEQFFFGVRVVPAEPPSLERSGDVWKVGYAARIAHVPHSRGMEDLFRLLAQPGARIRAAELIGAPPAGADPVLDDAARAAYRTRLRDLDEAIEEASPEQRVGLEAERDAVLRELRAATGLRGRRRKLGAPEERARKAVTGRIRDAIERIRAVHPELAEHLDAAIVTGTLCSYEPP